MTAIPMKGEKGEITLGNHPGEKGENQGEREGPPLGEGPFHPGFTYHPTTHIHLTAPGE